MTVATHPLARAVQPLARRAAPDAELVARFVDGRDQAAFAELVRRHGPTVLAACRHVTRHSHDADDAFQATFLVLAKKAHTLDPARPLAAWLRGVALRAGRKAAGRRRWLPLVEVARPETRSDGEAVAAVRAAVAGLPAHQRQAVERCELHGRPRAEVARELGIPPGTLSSRLALARRALAARLRRAGFAPVVVPAALARATASEVPSRRVVELAEAVMRTTTWHGWAVLAMAVSAVVGAGLASEPAPMPRPAEVNQGDGRLFLIDHSVGGPAFLWVDPDGGRPRRLTEKNVRAAGADLWEGIAFSSDFTIRRYTQFSTAGVARPNGEVPLDTRKGTVLLSPTDPPTVRPLAPGKLGRGTVAAWSADGRVCVFRDNNTEAYSRLDTATGERTSLAVPDRHVVCGWSPANDWLLTRADDRSPLARFLGANNDGGRLHRVAPDGTATELAGGELWVLPCLSPDGARVAYWNWAAADGPVEFTANVPGPGVRQVEAREMVSDPGFTLGVAGVTARAVSPARRLTHPKASCMGLAWAPDGRRLAYVEHRTNPDGKSATSHLWVCDADGGNRREVPLPAGIVTCGLLAWR